MEQTPNLGLPLLMASQAQKHITHNEALTRLDHLVQLSVFGWLVNTPPTAPSENDAYIIGEQPTGAWATHASKIALYNQGVWIFYHPAPGWLALLESENILISWNGTKWTEVGVAKMSSFDKISINTDFDDIALLSVASENIIFSHNPNTTGAVSVKINKQNPSDSATTLFQTAFSGRAEVGLAGNDEFSIKVSPNGTSWLTAISTEASSGNARAHERFLIGEGTYRSNGLTIAKPNPSITIQDVGSLGNTQSGVISWVDGQGDEKAWVGLGSSGNSLFSFLTRYEDGMSFIVLGGNYPIEFKQHGSIRIKVHTNGHVGINEASPTAPLHVGGALRVGSSTVADLPPASEVGSGTLLFVSDEVGGATLAFSDGTDWRRIQDRAVISST